MFFQNNLKKIVLTNKLKNNFFFIFYKMKICLETLNVVHLTSVFPNNILKLNFIHHILFSIILYYHIIDNNLKIVT